MGMTGEGGREEGEGEEEGWGRAVNKEPFMVGDLVNYNRAVTVNRRVSDTKPQSGICCGLLAAIEYTYRSDD